MSHVHVLVEGPTEERFIKQVLVPHLASVGVFADVSILRTKRRKSGETWSGGAVNLDRLLANIGHLLGDSSADIVTTMFDYYALPSDFPGLGEARGLSGAINRASAVEAQLDTVVQHRSTHANVAGRVRFASHLSIHEFEAFLFVDPKVTATSLGRSDQEHKVQTVASAFASPEDINDSYQTCPSQRIEDMFAGYDKVFYGPLIAERVGLDRLRGSCPHFGAWVTMLEGLGR